MCSASVNYHEFFLDCVHFMKLSYKLTESSVSVLKCEMQKKPYNIIKNSFNGTQSELCALARTFISRTQKNTSKKNCLCKYYYRNHIAKKTAILLAFYVCIFLCQVHEKNNETQV